MRLSCLLALAAFAATAAEPDLLAEIATEESTHKVMAAQLANNITELARVRERSLETKNRAAMKARWEELYRECQGMLVKENAVRQSNRSHLNVLKLELLAKTVPAKGTPNGNQVVADFSARVVKHEAQASEMRAVSIRNANALDLEAAKWGALMQSQKQQAEGLPSAGAVTAALAAAALALAGLYAWSRSGTPALAYTAAPALPRMTAGRNIELGELLGRGSMGEVYAGRDKTLDRRVAVKRLRPELAGNPAELERLFAQARLMAGLKHPNIIQVHSVERDGNEAFLVLELAEGRTLSAVLAKDGPLPWEDARRMSRAVAEGLDYAHVRGITHGDLKPSNVMIAPDGRVKVMDFALAYAAKSTVSRLTRSDAFGGLPYMSPEQELGDPGPGADAYALAACFYEALTGQRPFPGPDFLAQKRAGQYTPASALAKRLPPGADSLFKIAFNKDPERRFPGPAALAAAADAL